MRQPIYYLPAKTSEYSAKGVVSGERLAELGLGHLAEEIPDIKFVTRDIVSSGPDGGTGSLVSYEAQARKEGERTIKKFGYYANEQTWQKVDDEKRIWLGFTTAAPPQEIDLRRKFNFAGQTTVLCDLEEWCLPVVRREDGRSDLPHSIKMNPYREALKEQYKSIWERTGKAFDWMMAGAEESPDFNNETAVSLGLEGLALNYRVGPYEQNAIQMIDSTNWLNVLLCMLDYKQMIMIAEVQKKRALLSQAELASSLRGLEEEIPDTDQAGAISSLLPTA